MTRCKRLAIILFLCLLVSEGNCDIPTDTDKSSVTFLMSDDGIANDEEQKKEINIYTEIPNGYKVSTSSETKSDYGHTTSTESNDGYTMSTASESRNGQPTRRYSQIRYTNGYPYDQPPPPYDGYGYNMGQPYGYNPLGYYPPPYFGGYSNPHHYNSPPNYYNMPPPQINGQGPSFGNFDDDDYLKSMINGYEMARRIRSGGRRVPKHFGGG